MDLARVRALIPLPDRDMVPPPGLFLHASDIHGQAHVARVLVHGLRLIEATGFVEELPRLWAAVYLHDLSRHHDGVCHRHGADAWARLATLPSVQALLIRGGVCKADHPAIEFAITIHCKGEPLRSDPYWRLASLLKDADGLDRVRLGDLDPKYLRHGEARSMVGFAERLYDETDGSLDPGPEYFPRLWRKVNRILT